MSYHKTTIKNVIRDIDQSKIYLPAIQRKFIWGKYQIELLFDSLMRNYPFGTFLFWQLSSQSARNYVFYEFLKEYDQRNPYNRRKTGAFLHQEITGVLDGQQRLSSMYIGLMGTHMEKAPRKRNTNPNAYEKKCLYLNLLSLPYRINAQDNTITVSEDQNFEFRFLTEDGAPSCVSRKEGECDKPMFWMKVGEVLEWDEDPEFDKFIGDFQNQCRTVSQKTAISENLRTIKKGLETLHTRIHKNELINFFQVTKDDLEDILKIFVRVNSGGTILSKTDLLFSTIVATWSDGREQIENLLKTINETGDGFSFNNEYLMRCCLVLSDGPVVYKVNSFKVENVQRIQTEWPKIAEAIKKTVNLLVEFGFSGSLLTSQNATIIIAYYLYKGGDLGQESKRNIQKYMVHALLNGIYGGAQEGVIAALRKHFSQQERVANFSFNEILKVTLPQQKSLAITELDLEKFLQSTKGPWSFLLLSLLYPQLRYNEVSFHQDHIHPAAGFTDVNFRRMEILETDWALWKGNRDRLPNLQLMEGRQNISKNDTPLEQWVKGLDGAVRTSFFRENYFPENIGLEFSNFDTFFQQRKEVLRRELKKVLVLIPDRQLNNTDGVRSVELATWEGQDEDVEEHENQTMQEYDHDTHRPT